MSKPKRRGCLTISPELLCGLLGLKKATILDAKIDHFAGGNIVLAIESLDMPEIREGEVPRTFTLEELKRG